MKDLYLERLGWTVGDTRQVSDPYEGLGWADFMSVNVLKSNRLLLGSSKTATMRSSAILVELCPEKGRG